jgi:uncharacterized protein
MLKVDLGQLQGGARLRIDARVPATDPLWGGSPPDGLEVLEVRLEVQAAGGDVIVRGEIEGTVRAACRRCLEPVATSFREPVTLLFRPGLEGEAVDREEAYTLPTRAREIDLGPAVREHALLAVPEYLLCRAECAGLCPRCGADLNRGPCGCTSEEMDERWAALRRLRSDG